MRAVLFISLLFLQNGFAAESKIDSASPDQVKTALKSKSATLIDVREKDEVSSGMIKAAIWIPLSEIQSGGPALEKKLTPLDKTKELILYCRSGHRASIAGALLIQKGFKVRNAGGFSDLQKAGLETIAK